MSSYPILFDCILTATGTESSAVRVGANGTAIIVDNILHGEVQDITVSNSGVAEVEGNVLETWTLGLSATVVPYYGDRSAFDALNYKVRHANDIDSAVTSIHHTLGTGAAQAAAGNHTHAGAGTVTNIATGTGLTGGPITTTGTISDANTGVVAATYGDASNIPQIAVNAQGRITAASNIAVSIFTPINVYNETILADGISTIYYLANYAAPSTIRVYIDGIRQPASDDSAPTDIVTFSVAPDLGAVLLFDYEMDVI